MERLLIGRSRSGWWEGVKRVCGPVARRARASAGRRPRGSARQGPRPTGGVPPTTWWRPVPVRQLTSASSPGSSASQTWPTAVATRSVTAPSNLTVPPASTTTRSQSAATSSVWWVDSSTVERWPRADNVRRRSARCAGSSPVVGSSSTTSRGSPSSACASPTRRRCPPDSRLIRTEARSASPTASSTRRTSWDRALAVVPLLEDGDVLDEPEGGHVRGVAELLRQVAELATHRGHLGLRAVRVAPEQPHLAAVRSDRGGDDAQQRRLAGAVGTEQTGDASVEGEVDVGEGAGAAVRACRRRSARRCSQPVLTTPPPAAGRCRPGSR